MKKVVDEVAAELPGGVDDPNFMARLEARSKDLFEMVGPAHPPNKRLKLTARVD